MLETNSPIQIIKYCIIPQIKVCICAEALFIFADMWNMVEQPMLYLNDNKFRNLSAFIVQVDNYNPEVLMPASVFFILPVFLFYLLFHDELKRGFKI